MYVIMWCRQWKDNMTAYRSEVLHSVIFLYICYAMLDKPHVQQIRPLVTGSTEWWDSYNRGSSLPQHKDNKQKQSCRASVKERKRFKSLRSSAFSLQKPGLLWTKMDEVRTIVHWGLLHPAIPDETPPTSKTVKTWAGCFFAATRLCWEYRLEYFWISGPGGVHYIHTLLTTVTADKCIQVYASHKPWMTREVRTLLSNRNTAFRSDDLELHNAATANLKRGIRQAKLDYNN